MPPARWRDLGRWSCSLLLLLACRSGDIAGTGAACSADDDCRAGYRCVRALSRCAPKDEASLPPDASSPSDVMAPPPDLAPDALLPTITPKQLPGLVLWLEAGVGITLDFGSVSRWEDRSGHGNHAVQDVATMRPTLVIRSGHKVLVFEPGGVVMRVADHPSLQWGTDDWAVFIVASTTNALDDSALFIRKQDALFPYQGWMFTTTSLDAHEQGAGKLCVQLRYLDVRLCSNGSDYNRGALVLFGVQRTDGDLLTVRVNGSATGPKHVPVLDVSAPGQDLFIGGHGSQPTFQLKGTIAEVVAVRGLLADTDRDALERHFLEKYGLR